MAAVCRFLGVDKKQKYFVEQALRAIDSFNLITTARQFFLVLYFIISKSWKDWLKSINIEPFHAVIPSQEGNKITFKDLHLL